MNHRLELDVCNVTDAINDFFTSSYFWKKIHLIYFHFQILVRALSDIAAELEVQLKIIGKLLRFVGWLRLTESSLLCKRAI